MDFTPQELKNFETFFPFAFEKRRGMLKHDGRFAHYTSAEAAVSILKNRRVWMRRTSVMNDYREFDYGKTCLQDALKSSTASRLRALLDNVRSGLLQEVLDRLGQWVPTYRTDTFLTCISEHLPEEDPIGRLSMWRAYGGTTGVALIVKNRPFLSAIDAKAYTSPVLYADSAKFLRKFQDVVDSIEANLEFVKSLPPDDVFDTAFHMLRNAMLCTKHPGFHEEREWRIIYSPTFDPSPVFETEVVTVRGVPQQIYKIPLDNLPDQGLVDVHPAQLLDRIIIGPSQYPFPMYDAFVRLLKDLGVSDAYKKVVVSDIPLRQ